MGRAARNIRAKAELRVCKISKRKVTAMCDYSLHSVSSRPARVGDKLITSNFDNTLTRGFAAAAEPEVAVCLLPGTELAFDQDVELHYGRIQTLFFKKDKWRFSHRVARFRQINVDNPNSHHDAIEFPDGRVVLLTRLRAGQQATILQLPTRQHSHLGTTMPAPAASRVGAR